jgi:hypothetical protein
MFLLFEGALGLLVSRTLWGGILIGGALFALWAH